jgi:uncharacterized delta-60 repeat protein
MPPFGAVLRGIRFTATVDSDMGYGNRMRRFGPPVMTIAIGLALLVPSASPAAGNVLPGAVLDPSFGTGGVLKLPTESIFTAYGMATQSGNLLVSGGSAVQVLNSLGGTGEAFGGVGSLTLPPATGDEFQLSDFTIDPQGRLLVVGTSFFPRSENPSPFLENGARAFRPGVVRILRFLADGSLDPAFGRGGVVETGLGLSSPRGTDGRRLGSHPSEGPTGVAVDPQGRIIVTGEAVIRLGETCENDSLAPAAVSAGFVARLTESGAPDMSFGRDGLVGGRALSENPLGAEAIAEPLVSPSGRITYLSSGASVCERDRSHLGIAQLTPDRRSRRAFGKKGAIVGPYRALAEEPDGSVVALAEVPRREKEAFRSRLIRIAPDGKRDGSFGKHGRTEVKLGPGFETTLDSLAVDGQGRILVGGTLGTGKGRSIVLLRVSARGRWETNFGPRGRVATRVRYLTQFGSSDLFFDPEGRLVTVHQYAEELKGRSGLVVARYLLRN